ncbi:MAM and LDL-receptor class A domain-containing protein 1 [Biomphalaria pfeifferi]|uniref:MAM and LDL-receptor class A domain-containing protein 1 n=1 Tax=Biomphalaria pfeifferi TaxID=112525 RepID=A0AAD8BF35_BIOPF|nr:MAM and LDL-receptor class A domain-containing protein 1 [Biomphalaria pfeifferi]
MVPICFGIILLATLCVYSNPIDPPCRKLDLPNGHFSYRRQRSNAPYVNFTCKPGFQLLGANVALCIKGEWTNPEPKCIAAGCITPSVDPPLSILTFYGGALLQFVCDVGFRRKGHEAVYCNGSHWNEEPPSCEVNQSHGCDFEDGLCGWSRDLTGNITWIRHRGKTPTLNTGPSVDHTTNQTFGYYLYIESSVPEPSGKVARILSPLYFEHELDGLCLEFFYHMYGDDDLGSLEVVVLLPVNVTFEELNSSQKVFLEKGNKGNRWIRAEVAISDQTEPFQIVLQATLSPSVASDIAVDDLLFVNCSETTVSTLFTTQYEVSSDGLADSTSTWAATTVKGLVLVVTESQDTTLKDSPATGAENDSTAPFTSEPSGTSGVTKISSYEFSDSSLTTETSDSKQELDAHILFTIIFSVVSVLCLGGMLIGVSVWRWAKNKDRKENVLKIIKFDRVRLQNKTEIEAHK